MTWRHSKTAVASLALAALLAPSVTSANTHIEEHSIVSNVGASACANSTVDLSSIVGTATTTVNLRLSISSGAVFVWFGPSSTNAPNPTGSIAGGNIAGGVVGDTYAVAQTNSAGVLTYKVQSGCGITAQLFLESWYDNTNSSSQSGTSTSTIVYGYSTTTLSADGGSYSLAFAFLLYFGSFFGTVWLMRKK